MCGDIPVASQENSNFDLDLWVLFHFTSQVFFFFPCYARKILFEETDAVVYVVLRRIMVIQTLFGILGQEPP